MDFCHTLIRWSAATTLALCTVGPAASDEVPKEPVPEQANPISIFGDGYSIQEVPGPAQIPDNMSFSPSPSGKILLYHSNDECLVFSLGDSGLEGPWGYSEGSRTRDHKLYANPYPRWVLGPEGEEVFLLDVEEQRGLTLEKGSIVPWDTDTCSDHDPDWFSHAGCSHRARGTACALTNLIESRRESTSYESAFPVAVKMVRGPKVYANVNVCVEKLISVSDHPCAAVVYPRHGDYLVSINFETGIAKELRALEGLRGDADYSSAHYSPDGRWIFGNFNYGHLGHEAGGAVQLFDREGGYVGQLGAFSKDGPNNGAGWSCWLPNGWIIYGDWKEVHFLRYVPDVEQPR